MKKYDIGFDRAYQLAMEHVPIMESERLPISDAYGRVIATDIHALVDSPSIRASTKDGYAVLSTDVETATAEKPLQLAVLGQVAAGGLCAQAVFSGKTIRVLTGAPIPEGADAVLADEFVIQKDGSILAIADSPRGKNILPCGADVQKGQRIAEKGSVLTPQLACLIAAGGIHTLEVTGSPVVGLLATGSEVLLPGSSMESGKLFASNVVLQEGWLRNRRFATRLLHAGDDDVQIRHAVETMISESDVLLTSGGAWKGDRDLTVSVLESLGWRKIFHHVRMGPGKAVGMGLLYGKPVFCLPGGPTSNEMAFFMIALPAIFKMTGYRTSPFIHLVGMLESDIQGDVDWTQFVECRIIPSGQTVMLRPEKLQSRLVSIARTQAIVQIPEGTSVISAGTDVPFICINNDVFSMMR